MSQTWRRAGCRSLALVGCLLVCGCSGGSNLPARSPVTGTVLLHGEPAAGVNVQFIPLDEVKGRSASGQTDAQGKYVLQTFEAKDGAVPGDYKVVVTRPISDAEAFKDKKVEGGGTTGSEGKKIPEKFTNPKTTDLQATVEAAPNEIPFDLK